MGDEERRGEEIFEGEKGGGGRGSRVIIIIITNITIYDAVSIISYSLF